MPARDDGRPADDRVAKAEKLMMDRMHLERPKLAKRVPPQKPVPVVRAHERTLDQHPKAIRKAILRKSIRRQNGRYPW